MMYIITYICLLSTFVGIHADGELAFQQQPIHSARDKTNPFDPKFDDYVEDLLKECHVPGVSIAVVDNGKIYSKGYGFAVLPDQKATADTRYFTASTTKAFTAAAAGLIVHDNANYSDMHWTTPINSAIRGDFVLDDEWATNHITIEDALSHRTGLPGHDLFYGQEGDTVSKVIQRLRYLPMTAEPRVEWQYCNVMFAVVTDLIQAITGRTLETVLREWIWEPLGMRSTTFTIPSAEDKGSKLARGYYWDPNNDNSSGAFSDGNYVPERHVDLLCTAGDGATISTVNDYALWIRALISASDDEVSWNHSSPISPMLFRDLVAPRAIVPVFGQPDNAQTFVPLLYALGWFVGTIGRQPLLAHSGGITGFGTELYILPGLKYGVVTMQNRLSPDSDPSAIIAARLVLEKLGFKGAHTVESLAIQNSLLDIQKASRQTVTARRRRRSSSLSSLKPSSQAEALPLPLPLNDFTGLYSHPAYGIFNLTVNSASPSSSSQGLEGLFHLRTTSLKIAFTHISGTLFNVDFFEPHGLGDIVTGEGIVWEDLMEDDFEAYAVFEFGADGQSVDKLGIELDPDMIEKVRKKGSSFWRESMIWFKKIQ